jgi:hypothetical protein
MAEPTQHPLGQLDILDTIIDICESEKSYGTIVLFSLISKHHHGIVRPRLSRIKKRVVLDLVDMEWRNKDNDPNIE